MYKIYDINSEVFSNLTTEEQNNFFNQIKAEYNEQTIKWYLTILNLDDKFLDFSIINPWFLYYNLDIYLFSKLLYYVIHLN